MIERRRDRPTGIDVARLARVAQSTVSLVFSGKSEGRVSPELDRRIRKAAKTLGYQPLPSGRALSSGRSHSIGLVVTDFENAFFGSFSRGAQRIANELGYSVVLMEAGDSPKDFPAYRALTAGYVDGLLVFAIAPPNVPSRDRRLITLVESVFDGYSSVILDAPSGLRETVRHLASLGHRRIAYLGIDNGRWTFVRRREAFVEAMREHDLEVGDNLIRDAHFDFDSLVAASGPWLRGKQRPSAIVCADDLVASAIYRAAAMAEISIPSALSVVSFGGAILSRVLTPQLTSLNVSATLLGETAMRLQLSRSGAGWRPERLALPLALRIGQSTAAPSPALR
jgi:LacI family repressor for deo operon, udp, cdd, tsx, nupC, and nupG